jgi:hypothetical protein
MLVAVSELPSQLPDVWMLLTVGAMSLLSALTVESWVAEMPLAVAPEELLYTVARIVLPSQSSLELSSTQIPAANGLGTLMSSSESEVKRVTLPSVRTSRDIPAAWKCAAVNRRHNVIVIGFNYGTLGCRYTLRCGGRGVAVHNHTNGVAFTLKPGIAPERNTCS